MSASCDVRMVFTTTFIPPNFPFRVSANPSAIAFLETVNLVDVPTRYLAGTWREAPASSCISVKACDLVTSWTRFSSSTLKGDGKMGAVSRGGRHGGLESAYFVDDVYNGDGILSPELQGDVSVLLALNKCCQ